MQIQNILMRNDKFDMLRKMKSCKKFFTLSHTQKKGGVKKKKTRSQIYLHVQNKS